MPLRAHAVAIIVAGLLQLTLDQIAWSLYGILVLGACSLRVIFTTFVCMFSESVFAMILGLSLSATVTLVS